MTEIIKNEKWFCKVCKSIFTDDQLGQKTNTDLSGFFCPKCNHSNNKINIVGAIQTVMKYNATPEGYADMSTMLVRVKEVPKQKSIMIDFTCPFCSGKMIDIEGHYICQECSWIEGDDCPPNDDMVIPE